MTEAQTRALWAAVLISLGEAIRAGLTQIPTNVKVWTQYITAGELLALADNSYTEPLPIQFTATSAFVTVPTGKLLDLPIEWTMQVDLKADNHNTDLMRKAFAAHNSDCVHGASDD